MRRWVFTVLPVLFLAWGCSRIQFAYRHAEWLLKPLIYGYCDFSKDQKAQIDQELNLYLSWNRGQMLSRYVDFFREVQVLIRNDVTLEMLQGTRKRSLLMMRDSIVPLLAPTARIVSTLSVDQILDLEKTFENQTKKALREAESPRSKRMVSLIEEWAGSLSKKQALQIKEWVEQTPMRPEQWIERRRIKKAGFIELLRKPSTEFLSDAVRVSKIESYLKSWLFEFTGDHPDPVAEKAFDELAQKVIQIFSERQILTLKRKFKNFEEDLAELLVKK